MSLSKGALACAFLAAFLILGNAVSHRPPGAFDRAVHDAFAGRELALASVLTQSGRLPAYIAVCVLALGFGVVRRAWLMRAVQSVLVLLAADLTSNLFKAHFARARPPDQHVFFEPSYSYASGHATLALTFYGGWAIYAWNSGLPRRTRVAIAAGAALLIGAISWSRLALAAHWGTDVLGGLLLGGFFVVLQAAAQPARARERTPRPEGIPPGAPETAVWVTHLAWNPSKELK
jgi:membrane-associated phospholipid phosphatase